jgi:hypothetical protein
MTDNEQDRVAAIRTRFKEMGIETSEPAWSSWVLDRLLEGAAAPDGSLRAIYVGLDAALRDYSVRLTRTVANLIKDVVTQGFVQHGQAYKRINWGWANETLKRGPSAARCYLFLLALPPEEAAPSSIVAILRGLQGTAYGQDALNILSDDLEKPEIRQLLSPDPQHAVELPPEPTRG